MAGLPALGAVWGFRGAEELTAAGADELVYQPADILPTSAGPTLR